MFTIGENIFWIYSCNKMLLKSEIGLLAFMKRLNK